MKWIFSAGSLVISLALISQFSGCATQIPPGPDPGAMYLGRSVMATPYPATIAGKAVADVCLPAGLPVIKSGDTYKNKGPIVTVDGALISGWGAFFSDTQPVDCRDGKTYIWQKGEQDSYALKDSASGNPPTLLPVVTTAPGAASAAVPVPVKNEADFKSGFAGNNITLSSVDPHGKPGAPICLPRGTRMSVWIDSTDMARTVVEPVDQSASQCDGSPIPKPAGATTVTYYGWTSGVAKNLTSWQFASGVLVVPFKYYLGGNRGFVGSQAVGPYIGARVRWSDSGLEWTTAVFAGQTTVSVPIAAPSGSTAQSTSVAGWTGGIAILTSLGDNTKGEAGIVFGRDIVSKNVNWENNGKTWVALQFAYSFF